MIKFHKVSLEQYAKDARAIFGDTISDEEIKRQWEKIKLPERSTKGSAGYDFFAPLGFVVTSESAIKVPTGVRCEMDDNVVLMLFPRSGQGFKYGMHLANTVGVIDSDYFGADNEGHIQAKYLLESAISPNSPCIVEEGKAFMQGVFVKYEVTEDDKADGIRKGGFGSTDQKR